MGLASHLGSNGKIWVSASRRQSSIFCDGFGPDGKSRLILVTPRSVVKWQQTGFRMYGTWLSRARQVSGRKLVSKEVRAPNLSYGRGEPDAGAPSIHGELLKFGFQSIGANGLTLASTGLAESRCGQALADVSTKL
jgi:hypothetical protein